MIILGLHGGVTIGQHDPSAALIIDGKIVAACEEERYLRIKSSYGYLPLYSINACLSIAGIKAEDIDLIVTPGITYGDFSERIRLHFYNHFGTCPKIESVHHQEAHLACAFYGSGLDSAMCLSLDATGDGASGMIGFATKDSGIKIARTLKTEESIGYFYSIITDYLGFQDGDEYKVMGLAPYGSPTFDLQSIIKPVPGGWSFDWGCVREKPPLRSPFEAKYSDKLQSILKIPNRPQCRPLDQEHRNLARSAQEAFESCLLSLLDAHRPTNAERPNLCYAGGVAMNCAGNQKLIESGWFRDVYIPPVAADRGLALGCAYIGAVNNGENVEPIRSAYLGQSYSDETIEKELQANSISYRKSADVLGESAQLIASGKILGWFHGRSEAGARALGNRSIVSSPYPHTMRDQVNKKIKYREEFRPFAPAVIQESATDYFVTGGRRSPSMSFTFDCAPGQAEKIPAVVHVDNTSRIQTVAATDNPIFHGLISACRDLTGLPVLLNTSFNLKGQPIVESPRDAIMTFFGCGLDALVMGNIIVEKKF